MAALRTSAAGTAGVERTWERLARLGYAVSGLLHALIGVLGLQLAFGDSSGSADQSGALSQLSDQPFGSAVLWFAVVAFAALGVWQLAKALHLGATARRSGSGSGGDRAKAVGRGVVNLALAATAFSFARGSGSSSSDQTSDLTSSLMSAPGGRLLVGAIGLAVLVVGVYHVVKGWRRKFLEDLHGLPPAPADRPAVWCGVAGYVGKGVALLAVGALFVVAAAHGRSSEAQGLDGAMHALRELPAGPWVLALTALGFVAYGVYSVVRTRYGKV